MPLQTVMPIISKSPAGSREEDATGGELVGQAVQQGGAAVTLRRGDREKVVNRARHDDGSQSSETSGVVASAGRQEASDTGGLKLNMLSGQSISCRPHISRTTSAHDAGSCPSYCAARTVCALTPKAAASCCVPSVCMIVFVLAMHTVMSDFPTSVKSERHAGVGRVSAV